MKLLIRASIITLIFVISALPVGAVEGPTYTLTIQNHKFEPATLEIPANTKIDLHVQNKDSTPEEFESEALNREKVIPGGQEAVLHLDPLTAGTYNFFGDFNRTTAQGKLIVK